MSRKFIDYYNQELAYMREMAREFAQHYPKVASRLGMTATEDSDPYVERLLQGSSFLTTPIHMKMDAQFPTFTQSALERLCPIFARNIPSIGLIHFQINNKKGNLNEGSHIPRGSKLRARMPDGDDIYFRTTKDTTLWPLELMRAKAQSTDIKGMMRRFPVLRNKKIEQAITLSFNITGSIRLHELRRLQELDFYVDGEESLATMLMEAMMQHTVAIICHDDEQPVRWANMLPAGSLQQGGVTSEECLFGESRDNTSRGHCQAYEYFLFPEKFRFFKLSRLKEGFRLPSKLSTAEGVSRFEITLLLNKKYKQLESSLHKNNFRLFCSPIVNAFEHEIKNLFLEKLKPEHPLTESAGMQNRMEISSVSRIEGIPRDRYKPSIMLTELPAGTEANTPGYSIQKQTFSLDTDGAVKQQTLSLTIHHPDLLQAEQDILFVNVCTECSNGKLPLALNHGGRIDFRLDKYAPVEEIQLLVPLTKPKPALTESVGAWDLINQLNLQYLDFMKHQDAEHQANAFKDLLQTYLPAAGPAAAKQVASISEISMQAGYDRSPIPGQIIISRVVDITIELDETQFSALSPYLFGVMLEQFCASFISSQVGYRIRLHSQQRGAIHCSTVCRGQRPVN